MMKKKNRPYLPVGVLGLFMLAWSLVLMMVYPFRMAQPLDGIRTPIFALEFVEQPSDLDHILGAPHSPDAQLRRKAMDKGNTLDFLFMLLYGSFLGMLGWRVASAYWPKGAYVFLALPGITVCFDVLENLQLFRLTNPLFSSLSKPLQTHTISLLVRFTWSKWFCILALVILIAFFIHRVKRVYGAVVLGISTIALLSALWAFLSRSFLNELFVTLIELCFVLFLIFCFFQFDDVEGGRSG